MIANRSSTTRIGEAALPVSTSDDATALRLAADDWRRNSKTEAERLPMMV